MRNEILRVTKIFLRPLCPKAPNTRYQPVATNSSANVLRSSAKCSLRRYNNTVIALSENEERLVEALRTLPPAAADNLITWATQLSDLAKGGAIEWSDTWTDEDLADLRRASLANFDAHESGNG